MQGIPKENEGFWRSWGGGARRERAENDLKLSLSMGRKNIEIPYGCVMYMIVLCQWMCYVYGCDMYMLGCVMSMDVLCIRM